MSAPELTLPVYDSAVLAAQVARQSRTETELSSLLTVLGGTVRGQKRTKSIYAWLSAMYPRLFSGRFDCLFFSAYSTDLANALYTLWLSGRLDVAMWSSAGSPLHFLYHQPEGLRTQLVTEYELGPLANEQDVAQEALALATLPGQVSLWLLFLLEIYSSRRGNRETQARLGLEVPAVESDSHAAGLGDVTAAVDRLEADFAGENVSALDFSALSALEGEERLVVLFPARLDEPTRFWPLVRRRYEGTAIRVKATGNPLTVEVSVDDRKIPDMYNRFKLSHEALVDIANKLAEPDYSRMMCAYYRDLLDGIMPLEPGGEGETSDQATVRGWAQEQHAYLRSLAEDDDTRKPVPALVSRLGKFLPGIIIQRQQRLVHLLLSHYRLAEWRFGNIVRMLQEVAKASQQGAVGLSLDTSDVDMIAVELTFPSRFREALRQSMGDLEPLFPGRQFHFYHFCQPMELMAALLAGKDEFVRGQRDLAVVSFARRSTGGGE
jgi:hypothetical protein